MRMLLVTLLLICSLDQFARADDAVRRNELKDCGSIYDCYVPTTCTELDAQDQPLDMSVATVVAVKSNTKIYPHCPAVVQIHLYAKYLAHVIIEGLMKTTKQIEFFRTGNSQTDTMFCNLKDALTPAVEKLYGAYEIYLNKKTKKEYMQFDHNSENIKCEFEIKLSKKYEIFKTKPEYVNSLFQFKINGGSETLKAGINVALPILKCDPGKLIHSLDGTEPTKKYEKIHYSPRRFFCKDEVFEIEYKQKGGGFRKISKIGCESDANNKFKFAVPKINSIENDFVEEAEMRCVADVNLFCDEGVKVHEKKGKENGPFYVEPVRANKKAGSLKCADKAPHLVVKDIDKPIKNATFECTKFGKDQFWTVNRVNMPPIRLTKDGPEVYCIDTLDCHLHLRIPESSVIGGDLDESTHLPKCGDKGILHVINGNKKARINPPYCNFQTGEYEYNETMRSDHTEVVVETTKFECTYPEERREEIIPASVGAQVGASIFGVIGAIAVGSAIIGGLAALATRRQKKAMAKQKEKERKEQAYGQKVWKRYCMDANEKELILKNIVKKETEEKTPKALLAGTEVYSWNRMLMHFQRRGFEHTGATREGITVPTTRQDKHAQAQFDPETKDPKIAADYYLNNRNIDGLMSWDRTTVEKNLTALTTYDLCRCELEKEIDHQLGERDKDEWPVREMEVRMPLPDL